MMIEHGESFVTIHENVIESRLKGCFNELGCVAYVRKVQALVTGLANKPFVMLIDDLALEGGTPEAYAVLDEYNVWLSSQNIIAKAFLMRSSLQKDLTLKHTPSLLTQNVEFFQDKEAALSWLEQEVNRR